MAPSEITDDYYAILEVPHTAPFDIIKQSYRRLAKTLHPDKNPNKPDATASFQCLFSAYETVSDPAKRQAYDLQWVHIRHRQSTQKQAEKRQAEAAEAERKTAAEERSNKQRAQRASQERLRPLEEVRSSYERDMFEVNRIIRRLTAELKRLQDQDDEESRKERERTSWWTYFTSPVYSRVEETEEQKHQREIERLQRCASKSIKENDLNQKKVKLQSLKSASQMVSSKITAEKKKNEDEARAQTEKTEEARRRAEEQQARERWAEWEAAQAKSRREEAARTAKAHQAQEAREAQERVRRAQAAREAHEARKVQERAREARESEEIWARNKSQPATTPKRFFPASASTNKSTCHHAAFWPELQGRHLCSTCKTIQTRFAFQCPGCQLIACAKCRRSIRGERGQSNRGFRR